MDYLAIHATKPGRLRDSILGMLIFVILVSAGLTGCDTVSFLHPPGEGLASIRDCELEGLWLLVEDDDYHESGLLLVSFDEATGQVRASLHSLNDEEDPDEGLVGILYRSGDKNYLAFRDPDDSESDGYSLLSYRIADEKLLVWLAEVEPFILAVESGVLEGQVNHSVSSGPIKFESWHVVITDTEERTRNLVIRNHDAIFADDPELLLRYTWHGDEFRGR